MRLDIYVNYRGNCEEAFRFYERHLGGKITGVVRHGEQPDSGEIFMKMDETFFASRFAD